MSKSAPPAGWEILQGLGEVGWKAELGLRQPRRQLTDDAHQLLHG